MYKWTPYCCALRQIGRDCCCYAQEHHGKLHGHLGNLIVDAEMDAAVLCCPATLMGKGGGRGNPKEEIVAKSEKGHCSYFMVQGNGRADRSGR